MKKKSTKNEQRLLKVRLLAETEPIKVKTTKTLRQVGNCWKTKSICITTPCCSSAQMLKLLINNIKTIFRRYLTASSSSSSLTNCRGICRERALSAICSRTRRWLPSVVGNRYIRDITPPNTEADPNIHSQP